MTVRVYSFDDRFMAQSDPNDGGLMGRDNREPIDKSLFHFYYELPNGDCVLMSGFDNVETCGVVHEEAAEEVHDRTPSLNELAAYNPQAAQLADEMDQWEEKRR